MLYLYNMISAVEQLRQKIYDTSFYLIKLYDLAIIQKSFLAISENPVIL